VATSTVRVEPTADHTQPANGSAMAAWLSAGIGAFAIGAVVLVNEAGLFVVPAVYGPAGGVSGRTSVATIVWLVAWALLHYRWRDRELAPRRIHTLTLILTGLGILGTFPPLWALFGS
jgi:hypothetical protein